MEIKDKEHSSMFGIVTAISTVTGKEIDIMVMLKECKDCSMEEQRRNTGI